MAKILYKVLTFHFFLLMAIDEILIMFHLGGLGGRAIYLDADGSFCAERMNEIAEATKSSAIKQMEAIGTKYRYEIRSRLDLYGF